MRRDEFLSVQQFSKAKNVSTSTVMVWLKQGRLPGSIRLNGDRGPWLIPSSISNTDRNSLRERPKSSIETMEDARRIFNKSLWRRKSDITYDDLLNLFKKGETYKSIGALMGVSRQAVEQTYVKFFEPFLGKGKDRRKVATRKRWERAFNESLDKVESLSILKMALDDLDQRMTIAPVRMKRVPNRCYSGFADVNGKRCRVFHQPKTYRFGGLKRSYYRINISRNVLKRVEFVIIMTGPNAEKIFVIPSSFLSSSYMNDGKEYKMIYIPSQQLPAYRNQYPSVNWWSFLEAWDQLR